MVTGLRGCMIPFSSMIRIFIHSRTMRIIADLNNQCDFEESYCNIPNYLLLSQTSSNKMVAIFLSKFIPLSTRQAWSSVLSNAGRFLSFQSQLRDSRPNLTLFPFRVFSFSARTAESWLWLHLFVVRLRWSNICFRPMSIPWMNRYPSLVASS